MVASLVITAEGAGCGSPARPASYLCVEERERQPRAERAVRGSIIRLQMRQHEQLQELQGKSAGLVGVAADLPHAGHLNCLPCQDGCRKRSEKRESEA